MKRTATLWVTAALLTAPSMGQVTIGLPEMPAAGDALRLSRANLNLFINYGQTGPAHVWNYNNLQSVGEDTTSYQTVASTNLVYALVYADVFFNPNRANHATEGVDIPFYQQLPIEDPYTFLYRSSTEYRKVGFGAKLAGIPVPITFSQQDVIYQLPLHYGDASTSSSAWNVSVPTIAYYGYKQVRTNTVDGWGVINTPAGSFDVLRVKTTLAGRDTINVDTLGIGFAIQRPLVTEYKWLTPGLRVPVLQVNTSKVFGIEVVTGIYFYDVPRSITVQQPLAASLCPGSTLGITYGKTGVFNSGGLLIDANDFIVQLSDANGDFTNAVNIGQVTATGGGTIQVTIPANTPPGTGYRIRVVSTSPAFTGADNGFDITIGNTAPAASIAANGPVTFCAGGSVTLDGSSGGGLDYQWQLDGTDIQGASSATLVADAQGSYTVTVSNACGSSASAPLLVTVNDAPQAPAVLASDTTVFCDGGSVLLLADVMPGVSYAWSVDGNAIPGADSTQLSVTASGTYTVSVTDLNGCASTSTDLIEVTVNPPPAEPVIDQVADTLYATGQGSFQWYLDGQPIPGANDAWLLPGASGDYTVTVTDANGCSSTSQPYTYISTGVSVQVAQGLRAWPNPTTGSLWAEGPAGRWTVSDASGRLVQQGRMEAGPTPIDLGAVAPGMYELRLEGGAALRIVRQ